MEILRSVSFLSVLLVVFACARINMATNWADTYISHQLDNYFDMNSLQSHLLNKSLKEDIKKVRKLIFPQLASELLRIEWELQDVTHFDVEKISSYKIALRKIFDKGLGIFEVNSLEFVDRLNPSQLEHFRKEFNSKTKDLEDEARNPLAAKEKRVDSIKKQLEGWIGDLNSEQKKEIQKFCNLNLFPIKEQILNRNKLSKEFIDAFPDKEERKKFNHQLFYSYEAMREARYAKALDEDQHKYLELITIILNKMSNEQRKYLFDTIKDRADQFSKAATN